MIWTSLDTWIVVAGVLCAVPCALLGSFLVLRRMSMMGDAISHAVLPGLAIAFLITHSRDSIVMFFGAAVVGLLTALFTQWIHSFGQVDQSASMGVVFTVLFALGLVLIVQGADAVDLDPGCVLYGSIELVPLDKMDFAGMLIPRAVLTLGIVLLVDFIFVVLFYKELKISSFDPALATTLGINANVMHYLLMTLVAVTTVAAFESVGSILVIAMLIVPASAAHLLTDRLHTTLILSVIVAALAAAGGHVAAITVPTWFGFEDTSTAGMIAVVAGLLFMVTMLAAPRHGLISRFVRRLLLSFHITCEDVLGLLFRLEEAGVPGRSAAVSRLLRDASGSSTLLTRVAMANLCRKGKVALAGDAHQLTPAGRNEARQLVRAHRLWESYMYRHFGLPVDHLHAPAHRMEHYVTGSLQQALSRDLQDVEKDPHGQPIPGQKEVGDRPEE